MSDPLKQTPLLFGTGRNSCMERQTEFLNILCGFGFQRVVEDSRASSFPQIGNRIGVCEEDNLHPLVYLLKQADLLQRILVIELLAQQHDGISVFAQGMYRLSGIGYDVAVDAGIAHDTLQGRAFGAVAGYNCADHDLLLRLMIDSGG